jgi:O-antigen ligase
MLRPIAALLLIPAVYHLQLSELRRLKAIAILLGLTLLWMIAQMVPLPPGVWQALPDRQTIAELDALTGMEGIWRPLTMAPFRSLDTLLGMIVPVTALLLAVSMKVRPRILLSSIVGIGLLNAIFGLVQVLGGPRSPFYLFTITGRGAPVGLFANENHSAVFSAVTLLIITRLALGTRSNEDPVWIRLSFLPAFLLILLAVLVSGSRAGFATAIVALVASLAMAWQEHLRRGKSVKMSSQKRSFGPIAAGIGAAIVMIVGAFLWFDRTPAFEDILSRSSFEDMRWSLWPILSKMASNHWLLGTGMGSFDVVYNIYEPTELLLPLYVNHAHNDWAQIVIEGGMPATLLLAAFLLWMATAIRAAGESSDARGKTYVFWGACFLIIAAASLVDYPLRTPIFEASLIWLLICLAQEGARRPTAAH